MLTTQPSVLQAAIATLLVANYWEPTDKLHLFSNDLEIVAETVLGDFTECDFDGYGAEGLGDDWLPGIDPDSGKGITKYSSLVQFDAGAGIVGPQTVFGWYITDTTSATLKAAARLDTPTVMDTNGQLLLIVPWILTQMEANGHEEVIDVG